MEHEVGNAWGSLIPIKRTENGKLEEGNATVLSKDVVTIGRLPGMIPYLYCKKVRLEHSLRESANGWYGKSRKIKIAQYCK